MVTPGARLGPYEIVAALGSGGMGDVYRAKDTRLTREVAIKVVSSPVTMESTKRQRFEREARAIGALSHPHICALFDIGSQDGTEFLVMEYLEGETLERRLLRGRLPLQQAIRYAIEIAEALDHAHRHGIVHRDLKPANVMVTDAGAKLLDFGLAKWQARQPLQGFGDASGLSDTQSLTAEGRILGTLQYMAPEQVEGKEADARTDLFAAGAIVYEMVTGRRAFSGDSHASLVAAILTAEPVPMAAIEPRTPPGLERVTRRCLAKDPESRWQTARDLLNELRLIVDGGSRDAEPFGVGRNSRRVRLAWIGAGTLSLAILATVAIVALRGPTPNASPTFQFAVTPPPGSSFNPAPAFMAVSPDGRHLVFSAGNRNAGQALWLRSLDSVAVRQLTSEEGAQPFWSPDSQSIAYWAGGGYRRIDIRTGRVQTLIDANGQSGTWNRDGVIVMKLEDRPVLSRVSIAGGPATPATILDAARGETSHVWPQFLPDGRHFLFATRSSQSEYDRTICVGSLDSAARTTLFKADSHAVYAPPGYLLFVRGNVLVAQPFDDSLLRVTGEAVPIADQIDVGPGARAAFSVSSTGSTSVLAYRSIGQTQLKWVDRNGKVAESIGPPGNYANPALSPDGQRAAVSRRDPAIGAPDIWLVEFLAGNLSQFTSDPGSEDMPLWTPDGGRIVFRAMRQVGTPVRDTSATAFIEKPLDAARPARIVLNELGGFANPLGWSRQGGVLVYAQQRNRTLSDLWELPGAGDPAPLAFLRSEFQEIQGQPSPDGRWMAYVSNESGRYEVYVRSLNGQGKWPVSAAGGLEPKWRRDGRELFYLAADRSLMSVALRDTGPTLEIGTPTRLFETRMSTIPNTSYTRNQYDVTADGQRFLINQPPAEVSPAPISVIVNWQAAMTR